MFDSTNQRQKTESTVISDDDSLPPPAVKQRAPCFPAEEIEELGSEGAGTEQCHSLEARHSKVDRESFKDKRQFVH